jgi:hypothetical protein
MPVKIGILFYWFWNESTFKTVPPDYDLERSPTNPAGMVFFCSFFSSDADWNMEPVLHDEMKIPFYVNLMMVQIRIMLHLLEWRFELGISELESTT